MATLLLLLSGLYQSWGTFRSNGIRDCGTEPSKSGVIGMLAAALGLPRTADLRALTALKMGVRTDRAGTVCQDDRSGRVKGSRSARSYCLKNALFLVGLEGDFVFLSELHQALKSPVWPIYLGRSSYVPDIHPAIPLQYGGIQEGQSLMQALASFPYLGCSHPIPEHLLAFCDDPEGEVLRYDLPISFATRRFAVRRVRPRAIPAPPEPEDQALRQFVFSVRGPDWVNKLEG